MGGERDVVAGLGTILSVWAHPDDEAYLAGGVMAIAVAQGQRVVCVTATRGEGGSLDEQRWPSATMAEVRTIEMAASLGALGVTEHVWLDYPDGGCADVAVDDAAERLLAIAREVRPDTILTFGPDGITGHADHRAVSAWVDLTVSRMEDDLPRPRVLQAVETTEWWDAVGGTFDEYGVYMGFEPTRVPQAEVDVLVHVTGDLRATKFAAIAAQTSQTSGLIESIGAERFQDMTAEEAFVDA